MIRILFFSIVCAVSAPREGTAVIGRKSYGSNAFCHLDEGARKEAKPFSSRVYNVDAHNSSVFAKQKITNRTNSFRCDYINKQYQSSRSSSCSVMENVSPRKKKESFDADVGLAFRKRNLLWVTNKFSPKTLRPPMEAKNECQNALLNELKCENCYCETPRCPKPKCKCKCKRPKSRKKNPKVGPKAYSLDCCQRKNFLRLKKLNGKTHKRHLDKVKIDDELDLNKRIQKLVQEIAVENQRAAMTGSADLGISPQERLPGKWQKSFPFLKKLKKLFKFKENSSINKQLNNDKLNSVPVYSVRGEVPVAGKTARLSSYDVFKTVRKTARFRRNPYRNYVSYSQHENPVSRYRDNLMMRKPFSYSTNFKKEGKFLYPEYRQRRFTGIRRPHELFYCPRMGMKPWPLNKQFILQSNKVKDVRSKRHNAQPEQSTANEDAAIRNSDTAQTGKSAGHNNGEVITTESYHLEKQQDDLQSLGGEDPEKSDDEDVFPDQTLEKPLFERHFMHDLLNKRGPSADLKTFEDRYNLQTDFPLFDSPIALHPHRRYKYDLPKDGFLKPYRYLKIRHALRNYLIHNNIISPARLDLYNEREKRCGGGKCCPLPHKCWRSPPLLCIPYIRKGQDDLLRYLIKTMQKMIGRPFPPKIDIFDNTKFKPCGKMIDHSCDDISSDEDIECDCMTLSLPPSCMQCPPPPPPPPPSTQRTCPCQMDPVPEICPCSRRIMSIPKGCLSPNYPTAPFASRAKLYPPNQRSCPCGNYNHPCNYPPSGNAFRSNSAYPYSYDNMDQIMYSTQSYYGYDEPIPAFPSPCIPPNPYSRNSLLSTPPPLRSFSLASPRASTNYPPTPLPNIFPRATEQIPSVFTRPQYSSPSTANACSWYMSKSPVERSEYFAYTALPYNGPAEFYTTPSAQSDLFRPANLQSPYPNSNLQTNQLSAQKLNVQMTPAYEEQLPDPISPVMNPQPSIGRCMYENQCKDKRKSFGETNQSDQASAEQMNQMRKVDHGPTTFDMGDTFNENPQPMVRCDDQQHRLNDNQMPKSEMSSGYSKNDNKDNAYKTVDQQPVLNYQQLPKVEQNNEYPKPPGKEENPRDVQMHPMLAAEGNDGSVKNQNRQQYGYKCANQQYLNEQQMPKPEVNVKEVKNLNKDEAALRCSDQQHTANERPQLPKPDINEVNDDRRFFKTKHHKGILRNFRKPATEFFQPYDDYYDKYPFIDQEEQSSFRYGKSPFLRTWRGYNRKVKKSSKRGSSLRQKRGDNYYASPDNSEDYNDYESEVSYNDLVADDSKSSEEVPPDPNWTPPSYEMFSELAKAVTESTTGSGSKNTSASAIGTKEKNPCSVPSLEQIPGERHYDVTKKPPKVSSNVTSTNANFQGNLRGSSTDGNATTGVKVTAASTTAANTTAAITSEANTNGANTTAAKTTAKKTAAANTTAANTTAAITSEANTNGANTTAAKTTAKKTAAANTTAAITSEANTNGANTTAAKTTAKKTAAANTTAANTTAAITSEANTNGANTTAAKTIAKKTAAANTIAANTTAANANEGNTTAPIAIANSSTSSSDAAAATTSNTTTASGHESCADSGESINSKKSGKTGFFQTNSKALGIQSNSVFHTSMKVPNMASAREDKGLDGDQDLDSAEEGQIPTTLKMASIVKGPKKLLTKPSPKVYMKVYPDSMAIDTETNETTTAAVTTAKAVAEKTTIAVGSTSDVQVQLLAVCEGYLEVVKLIKAHNQSLGNDLDADLARYCENIISQNFNLQSDSSKPNKQESVQSSPPSEVKNSTAAAKTIKKPKKFDSNLSSTQPLHTSQAPEHETNEPEHRGKVVVDILNNPLAKRELSDKTKRKKGDFKRKKLKYAESEDANNEGMGVSNGKEKSLSRKNQETETKPFCLSTPSDFKYLPKKTKRYRRKDQSEEESLKKGITKEQMELLHLLRKRKRALLSWLYNSKEVPSKSNDAQETEYFDGEEDIARGSDIPSYSGTITPKECEDTSTMPESDSSFANESIFPVYAKEYGYDRGGELMEVEVLWRKINEKTHEKKIFRNRSVLALLLTSTNEPNTLREDTRFIANGFENEEMSEIQSKSENKVGYAGPVANVNKKTSTAPTVSKNQKSSSMNNTYTYIKPDPSSIVGAPPNVTTLHPNTSNKISHTFGAAKDLFQEYTLEFLNYAVYILPIMFTILFLFCCLCCAVQILKTKKCTKKRKKKKKRQVSTEESETSEDSERESKKKRREARRKKHSKDNPESLDKKRSKTFWNVLKLNAAKSNAEYNDDNQTEKKRSFLRFLKGRRDEGKTEFCSRYSPVREVEEQDDVTTHDIPRQCPVSDLEYHDLDTRRRKDENPKTYDQNEAEERRELIALLEELKKIETENTAEKKEVRSVQVQYMTQEEDTPVFQGPDFAFPYQKNVFGMPKGYSPCNKHFSFYQSDPAAVRDYELFEDVNELTELLPCECNYYSKRNDYLRRCDFKINQEGGCKSFIKIFRDAGVTRSKPFREKNLFKNESENRSFIFNKYRSISTDTSDELMGVTQNNAGTEVRLTDNKYETASPLKLQSKNTTDFVEEMDSLKRQLKNKKHVRLKDDGVLCRL